jgi:hypothetical protein
MGGQSSSENGSTDAGGGKPVDIKQAFQNADKDKDGSLDKSEITALMKQFGKSDADIKKTLDIIPNATVKFEEFKAYMEGKSPPAAAAPAPAAAAAPAPPEAAPAPESAPKEKEKKEKTDKKAKGANNEGKASKGEGKSKGKSQGKDGKAEKGKGKSFIGPFGGGSGFRLNVKNLQDDVDDANLKEMFESFGTVSGAQVKRQDNGKSRGFGFVVFSSEEEAQKAIADMHDKEIGGKKLNVAPAERRELPEGKGAENFDGFKGNGMGGKGQKGKAEMMMAQQQAMAAAYMQQYQQYYYLQQMAYYQQQQGAGGQTGQAEYEGSLKSVSGKNGYGFIVCQETHAIYQRDVYVDKEKLPEGAKVADRIIFTVEVNDKKHPRAATCRLAL